MHSRAAILSQILSRIEIKDHVEAYESNDSSLKLLDSSIYA